MPRVNSSVKSTRGNEVHCRKCSRKIEPGETYFHYKIKTGPASGRKYAHCKDHRPQASDLTNSKMSGVYEAQENGTADVDSAEGPDGIAQALRDAAEAVEGVKDEYQSSLDNMPENLQQGDTGQEIQGKVEELEQYQQALEDAADEIEGEELPDEETAKLWKLIPAAGTDLPKDVPEDGYESKEEAEENAKEAGMVDFNVEDYEDPDAESRTDKLEELKDTAREALGSLSI